MKDAQRNESTEGQGNVKSNGRTHQPIMKGSMARMPQQTPRDRFEEKVWALAYEEHGGAFVCTPSDVVSLLLRERRHVRRLIYREIKKLRPLVCKPTHSSFLRGKLVAYSELHAALKGRP